MAERSVTELLQAWSDGHPDAFEELIPHIVDELRRQADHYLRNESANITLQPTALVNEVYVKLVSWRKVQWENRLQFFAFAGKTMRRILVDRARRKLSHKRGAGHDPLTYEDALGDPRDSAGIDLPTLLALNQALDRLRAFDPRGTEIVELRFFAGLTVEETARALELSPATIKREWSIAKRWLASQLVTT